MDAEKIDKATELNEKVKKSSNETEHANYRRQYTRYNFIVYMEASERRAQQENHLQRLQNLRKQINHIKDTEWQFEPIEKYIGQS